MVDFIQSPNFWSGRPNGISHIVFHTMEASMSSAISWFKNPSSQASAHYLIGKDGHIVQMVNEGDRAWHAGTIAGINKKYFWSSENENERSIGYEMEGYAAEERPQPQLDSLIECVKKNIADYGIVINRSNIVAHADLSSDRSDPGKTFPWDWVFAKLQNKDPERVELNGFWIGGGFLQYFKNNGGIKIFGLPLSNEFDYQGRTTQILERAVFQFFPENPPPYDIQGMLVGKAWAISEGLL